MPGISSEDLPSGGELLGHICRMMLLVLCLLFAVEALAAGREAGTVVSVKPGAFVERDGKKKEPKPYGAGRSVEAILGHANAGGNDSASCRVRSKKQ